MAHASGDPFRDSPYFAAPEPDMDRQWDSLIWPLIHDADHSRTVDLAAGHGRNSVKLRMHADHLILVDINGECLDACHARFRGDPRISFLRTDGLSLDGIHDSSMTLVYCFDAMVHFAPEVVAAYLEETSRVLVTGGRAFFHHSNYSLQPESDFKDSEHWRHDMSLERLASLAEGAGLEVLHSRSIDWSHGDEVWEELDGLTLLRRP